MKYAVQGLVQAAAHDIMSTATHAKLMIPPIAVLMVKSASPTIFRTV